VTYVKLTTYRKENSLSYYAASISVWDNIFNCVFILGKSYICHLPLKETIDATRLFPTTILVVLRIALIEFIA
jgi:hypothetical protein